MVLDSHTRDQTAELREQNNWSAIQNPGLRCQFSHNSRLAKCRDLPGKNKYGFENLQKAKGCSLLQISCSLETEVLVPIFVISTGHLQRPKVLLGPLRLLSLVPDRTTTTCSSQTTAWSSVTSPWSATSVEKSGKYVAGNFFIKI